MYTLFCTKGNRQQMSVLVLDVIFWLLKFCLIILPDCTKLILICHLKQKSYHCPQVKWIVCSNDHTSTSSYWRKKLASSEGSKNKLMQTFQELDKMTHAETSADYWKSPSPLHLCSHFIMLTSQVPDNRMLGYWVNISVLCVQCSQIQSPQNQLMIEKVPEQLIYTSACLFHTLLILQTRCECLCRIFSVCRNFSSILQRCWVVKLGCQGDKKDVAVTTVQ